jgi:hypothetical protein
MKKKDNIPESHTILCGSGGNMTKIKLIVAIYGDLLNPTEFSKVVDIQPTSYWFKDDVIRQIHNPNTGEITDLKRKETCWEYSYEYIDTLFFGDISDLFVKQFTPNINEISDYISKNNLETKIYVVVEIENNETPALFFESSFLNLTSKMKGEIDMDLYIY